jgi:hypothetical protein
MRSVIDGRKSSRSDVVDEFSEKLVKDAGASQNGACFKPCRRWTALPQIRIFRHLEISRLIFGTIHGSQGNGTILDEPTLIYPDAEGAASKIIFRARPSARSTARRNRDLLPSRHCHSPLHHFGSSQTSGNRRPPRRDRCRETDIRPLCNSQTPSLMTIAGQF